MHEARAALASARRVVVKVGTSVVRRPDGGLALGRLGALVEAVAALRGQGRQVLLVSSGAIGLGWRRLGFDRRPTALADQQACAAAGQMALTGLYDSLFSRLGVGVAQVLLTEDDFDDRSRYLTLADTLERLLSLGAVPLVNENDATSPQHHAIFGDNDRLASLVATNIGCDALVLLSDVDGVYTAPPGEPGSARIDVWDEAREVRVGAVSDSGRGGIAAKIAAARLAARAGVPVVIASGFRPEALGEVVAGRDVGTVFAARGGLTRRRRWLAFATAPAGSLDVNEGAHAALVRRNASLLLPGVVGVQGDWEPGAVVRVRFEGREFARGRCDRSSAEVRAGLGVAGRAGKAVIHRDHVAILEPPFDG
jgi:glutamate 5-kinase